MPDQLILRRIRTEALIGVLPEERDARQPLFVTLKLDLDTAEVGWSDAMRDTIDYVAVIARVREFSAQFTGHTLEFFAHQLARALVQSFPNLLTVEITVAKPAYAEPLGLESVEIHVRR